MSYSKKELITKLREFEDKHGYLPTRQDFKDKKITPSHATFYRIFNGKENMIKELELYKKGELVFETKERAFEKQPKFRCLICGSHIQESFSHDTLKIILIMRFIDLLKKNGNSDYANAVFDCFGKVFGSGHQDVEQALRKEGFFNAYLQRLEDTNKHKEIYTLENRN